MLNERGVVNTATSCGAYNFEKRNFKREHIA